MEGPGDQLFDHIAKCLADFVHENHLQEETSRSALYITIARQIK
jgi:hypothetical protein